MPKLSELVTQPERRKLSQVTATAPRETRDDYFDPNEGTAFGEGGDYSLGALGRSVSRNLGSLVGSPEIGEQFVTGVGRNIDRTYRGVKQLGAESIANQSGMAASVLEALGARQPAQALARNVTLPAARVAERERVAERQNRLVPSTPAMTAGDIAGTVGGIVGPGALLRGTSAAPVFLPRTIAGNALQGGVIGAAQPVAEEGERGRQTLIGTAAGGAGAAIPQAVGGVIRTARAALQPFTQRGQEQIVADLIQRTATQPARLSTPTPSQVEGVRLNLAEETRDPGIAQLARQFPVQLADQAAANNAARVQAVRNTFRGADQPSIDAIEAARDDAADAALARLPSITNPTPEAPAFNAFGSIGVAAPVKTPLPQAVDLGPVARSLSSMADAARKRPAVQTPLNYVRDLLREPVRNAEEAYDVRKTIGDLMEGRIAGDLASSKVARAQLMQAREILDRQMEKAFPEWGRYLTGYREASRAADQARVGMRFLEGSGAPRGTDASGDVVLSPAALMAGRNADRLTQAATRFPRAQAAEALTPEQNQLLGNLARDADAMRAAQQAGRGPGSDTAQNLATQNVLRSLAGDNKLVGAALMSQPAKRMAGLAERTYSLFGVPDRLQTVLVDALANPQQARALLARLPQQDRLLITQALARIGGTGGALSPALTE